MNSLSKAVLPILVFGIASTAAADNTYNTYPDQSSNIQQTATNTQKLAEYLQSLGRYFGYEVSKDPEKAYSIDYKLINNLKELEPFFSTTISSFLGSIPANFLSFSFVPTTVPGAKDINEHANESFIQNSDLNTPLVDQSIFRNSQVSNQQKAQIDPTNQGILNILGTPDQSYCTEIYSDAYQKNPLEKCSLLNNTQVSANVIGKNIPNTYQFYNPQYLVQYLNQLNSNSLTAPLMYTTSQSGGTSSSSTQPNQSDGLNATNQAQEAANFIRYVSGAVAPLPLPDFKTYNNLYVKAMPKKVDDPVAQQKAIASISSYLANLRSYAAINSVGLSNLYYIMSKRMPQSTDSKNSQANTSEALNEFNMATRRLYKTDNSQGDSPWLEKINNAAPATVQKEIALLLAEINYQMYLDRQMNERLLLTNSVLLLINAHNAAPQSLSSSSSNPSTEQ